MSNVEAQDFAASINIKNSHRTL